MTDNKALPIHSSGYIELHDIFYTLEQPYDLHDIHRFNQAYERVYRQLQREEKRRAEIFVDTLIDGIEAPHLASKIFGVV
jgi:hypothetical protein